MTYSTDPGNEVINLPRTTRDGSSSGKVRADCHVVEADGGKVQQWRVDEVADPVERRHEHHGGEEVVVGREVLVVVRLHEQQDGADGGRHPSDAERRHRNDLAYVLKEVLDREVVLFVPLAVLGADRAVHRDDVHENQAGKHDCGARLPLAVLVGAERARESVVSSWRGECHHLA